MKKKGLVVLLFALGCVMTACSKPADTGSFPQSTATPENVTGKNPSESAPIVTSSEEPSSVTDTASDHSESPSETAEETKETDVATSAEETESTSNAPATSIAEGDFVYFGAYEQDGNKENGNEKIKWQIVQINENNAVLVSAYVIDYLERGEIKDIYKSVFDENEKEGIVSKGISLLSMEEAVEYFNMDEAGIENYSASITKPVTVFYSENALGIPTPYVNGKASTEKELTEKQYDNLVEIGISYDRSVIGKKYIEYWTSTPITAESTYTVDECGRIAVEVLTLQNGNERKNGIRPMVLVDLNKAEKLMSPAEKDLEEWMIPKETPVEEMITWEVNGNTLSIIGSEDFDKVKIPKEWRKNAPWADQADQIEIVELVHIYNTEDIFEDLPALKRVLLDENMKIREDDFSNCSDDLVIHYKGQTYNPKTIDSVT